MQRRFDEAEPLYRRAIALRIEALPATHTELANSFGNLGLLLHDTGQYSAAEDAFRHELEIREHDKRGSKTHTALALNNLGAALYLAGKLQDAADTFDRAVSYCRQHFGEEHAMTGDALQKLATTRAQISS
jgi:tetratricopeptide (TPR) repeat protein